MSALAEDLARVLIEGGADPDRIDRVDGALAGALDALASRVESLERNELVDAVAALAIQLLVDLRGGELDRIACRVAAPLVSERVENVLGPVEPLLGLLGALAAVPDGSDEASQALDPGPDPDLPVEVALAAALADPVRRSELLDVLATSTVHVPVLHAEVRQDQLALRFLPLVLRDGVAACAFSHPSRFEEVGAGGPDVPTMELTGAELVDLWPAGHALSLNPGHVVGAVITEREVRSLARRCA